MSQNDNDSASKNKKKSILNLLTIMEPVAEVKTAIGDVYLYPLRVSDLISFGKLKSTDPHKKFREYLPNVGSLENVSNLNQDRTPLPSALIDKLSDDEIEALAESYALSTTLQKEREGGDGLSQKDEELASAYLDRLLTKSLNDYAESMRSLRESMASSVTGVFDKVRKSSSLLGEKVSDYERVVAKAVAMPAIPDLHLSVTNQMAEIRAKEFSERAEELELARLTGEMTAQSAKTLKELAEAASTLLEDLAIRERRSAQTTKLQLWIAAISLAVSVLLSAAALGFSVAAYFQDNENYAVNDKWQIELLTAIEAGNRQRIAISDENRNLRLKIEELTGRITHQKSAAADKVKGR